MGRGARLLRPLSCIRRLGHHLRRRLCAVHGGRGPPYHSGSCSPGFSGYDLCGVPVRRRGPACSSRPPCEPAAGAGGRVTLRLPSRAGGGPSPLPRGPGGRDPAAGGLVGGAGGGGVAPRPPCSRSGRRPVVLFSGPLRVAGALPSGARVRSGLKCRPGVGGVRGGPWTAPPGAPADLNPPPVTSEWAVVTGGSCGARPPFCSVVRVAPARRCGFAGAGPAAVALTASPFLLRGGRPPGLGGAEGRACGSPAEVGAGGGVGGPPPRPLSGLCVRGGGDWGGPFGPLAKPPVGRGGGRHGSPGPGGRHGSPGPGNQPSAGGSRPSPAPLYPEPDSRAGPRWGPSSPGRCRAAPAGRGWP